MKKLVEQIGSIFVIDTRVEVQTGTAEAQKNKIFYMKLFCHLSPIFANDFTPMHCVHEDETECYQLIAASWKTRDI